MGKRAAPKPNERDTRSARETIFGAPPRTPEEAFVRFGNACHWEAELGDAQTSPHAFLTASLARLPRAQHRLVAEFIGHLLGGDYTFATALAIWKRSRTNNMAIGWDEPAQYLRFLLTVRDAIDPVAWPASKPRFRPDGAPKARP